MKRVLHRLALPLIAVLLTVFAVPGLSAAAVPGISPSDIVSDITRVAGSADPTKTTTHASSAFSFDAQGVKPIAEGTTLVYPNVTPGVSFVQRYAASDQLLIHITNAQASPTYALRYNNLPAGGWLDPAPDGALIVRNSTGGAVDTISPAWAKDAKLQDIPSKYRVTDAHAGLFAQDVEHNQPYVAYPVVADPFRLEIRFPGLRGYTGPNGLELRFNNYAAELSS